MIELSEDGFIELKLTVGEATVTKRIDVYEANNRLYELGRSFQGKTAWEYKAAVVEYLTTLGFPACSHRTADRFEAGIVALVDDMKKKDSASGKPDSPSATAPASLGPTPALSTV